MNEYIVSWRINAWAETPVDAAIEVAADYFQTRVQQGKPETACVFNVEKKGEPDDSEEIDLSQLAGTLTSAQLRKMFGEFEHPDYPKHQWRVAIDHEDTLLGYWDWVATEMKEDARS